MSQLLRILALALLLASCGGPPPASPPPAIGSLLPPGDRLDGWTTAGDLRLFRGAELYGHINGGAEIFLELGFDRLEVQEYRLADNEISLELYHMADPSAALGIYLMKCGDETPTSDLPYRHTATAMQLHLVHRELYLTVNNLAGSAAGTAALPQLARSVVEALPADSPAPPCLALLPSAGRIAGSMRIVRGPFTLQSLYSLGEGDVLQLLATDSTAAAADYGDPADPWTLIVADYGAPETAQQAFAHAGANLDPYLQVVERTGDRLGFMDWQDRRGELELAGSLIRVRVNLREESAGEG